MRNRTIDQFSLPEQSTRRREIGGLGGQPWSLPSLGKLLFQSGLVRRLLRINMVNFCCVPKCHSRSNREKVSFHRFPSADEEPETREAWLKAIRRANFTVKNFSRVCGKHFSPSDFVVGAKRKTLREGAVPSIFPDWPRHLQCVEKPKRRVPQRAVPDRSVDDETSSEKEEESLREGQGDGADEVMSDGERQSKDELTPDIAHDHSFYSKSMNSSRAGADGDDYVRKLEEELKLLRKRVISLDNIKDSDHEILHYTGFSCYRSFKAVFDYVEPFACRMSYWKGQANTGTEPSLSRYKRRSPILPLEEEFLAVLMRLRTGYRNRDIAKLFGLSPARFSNIFNTWICLLSDSLRELCKLPSREVTRDTLPSCFSAFPNTRIVIDCTEVFSQQASSLPARKQMFSSYKHTTTYKFLVGISPSGSIAYISEVFGGRASDKHITVSSSDLLQALGPGDAVMADRGFLIGDELKARGVELICPAFRGAHRAQLTGREVHDTRRIAEARIHVERAIGEIKNFCILAGDVPLSMKPILGRVFSTCAYLTNFQSPIITPESSES